MIENDRDIVWYSVIHLIQNDFDTFTSFIPCCILKLAVKELYKWMADSAIGIKRRRQFLRSLEFLTCFLRGLPNLSKPSQTFRCTFSIFQSCLRIHAGPFHAGPFHAHAPMLSLFVICHRIWLVTTRADSCSGARPGCDWWNSKFILCSLAWDSSRVHEISVLKEESSRRDQRIQHGIRCGSNGFRFCRFEKSRHLKSRVPHGDLKYFKIM